MVLISITSDPNDFLCAPPGGSVCSKPVHNWSNGIRTGGSGNKATTGPPPRVTSTAAEQSRNEDRLPSCAKIRQPVMWWRSYIQTCKRYLTIFRSHYYPDYYSSLSIDDKQTFRESLCYYSFHALLVINSQSEATTILSLLEGYFKYNKTRLAYMSAVYIVITALGADGEVDR